MTWIVNVKGDYECESFEISVVQDTNKHGLRSYGWFDHDKLLISHNGGPCQWPIAKKSIWDGLIKLARDTADELNREMKDPIKTLAEYLTGHLVAENSIGLNGTGMARERAKAFFDLREAFGISDYANAKEAVKVIRAALSASALHE